MVDARVSGPVDGLNEFSLVRKRYQNNSLTLQVTTEDTGYSVTFGSYRRLAYERPASEKA